MDSSDEDLRDISWHRSKFGNCPMRPKGASKETRGFTAAFAWEVRQAAQKACSSHGRLDANLAFLEPAASGSTLSPTRGMWQNVETGDGTERAACAFASADRLTSPRRTPSVSALAITRLACP
eukprot:scaffold367_cov254-Pinguiococcus_pyrenoidosus.AAC.13